jgi:hypothetical protein
MKYKLIPNLRSLFKIKKTNNYFIEYDSNDTNNEFPNWKYSQDISKPNLLSVHNKKIKNKINNQYQLKDNKLNSDKLMTTKFQKTNFFLCEQLPNLWKDTISILMVQSHIDTAYGYNIPPIHDNKYNLLKSPLSLYRHTDEYSVIRIREKKFCC